MSEEEIIKDFKSLINNAKANWEADNYEILIRFLDLYKQEKEKNKKLDRENQALYESINCNDNTMLARLYQEEKEKKDKIIDKMGQELFIEIEPHFDTLEQCIEFYTNKVEEENK